MNQSDYVVATHISNEPVPQAIGRPTKSRDEGGSTLSLTPAKSNAEHICDHK